MLAPLFPEPAGLEKTVQNPGHHRNRLWFLVTLTAVWALVINQLRVEWMINPQYSYGWVVPLLALYLYGERWRSRPEPAPNHPTSGLLFLAIGGMALLLPIRILQEAAADWRLVSWVLTATVIALSLLALQATGGKRWLKHFWFPVCFIIVAVPWPMPLENLLVQALMRMVASTCTEILWWCGVPALQEGNVIRVGATAVGVEEACSGVRSLQTTIMISFFLGELFQFSVWRRSLLVSGSLLIAFIFNLARAMALVWLATSHGPEELEHWHDPIGWTVLGTSLVMLLGLAALLRDRRRATTPTQAADLSPPSPIPCFLLKTMLAWLLFVECGTQLWYWAHERGIQRTSPWGIRFPEERASYQERPLPANTQVILRYDKSKTANWRDEEGRKWSMIFLRWNPGNASARLPHNHTPEICLAATGAKLESSLGAKQIEIGAARLLMYRYVFQVRGQPLYVFYALSEDRDTGSIEQPLSENVTWKLRVQDAMAGQRGMGQQVLEIAVSGFSEMAEAEAALIHLLTETVRGGFPPVPNAGIVSKEP